MNCACTSIVASKIVPLVFTWNEVPPAFCARPNRPYLRKMLNATAREWRWMMECGPPRVLPRENGSEICRTLIRWDGALDASAFIVSAIYAYMSPSRHRTRTFCPLLVDLEPAHIRMPPQLVHGGAARARRGHRPRAVGHLLAEAPLLAQK